MSIWRGLQQAHDHQRRGGAGGMGDSGSDDDDFQDEPHKRKGTKRRKQGATGGPRTAQPASFKDTGARTATGDNITPPTEYEEELFWCVHSPRVHTAPARAHSLLTTVLV